MFVDDRCTNTNTKTQYLGTSLDPVDGVRSPWPRPGSDHAEVAIARKSGVWASGSRKTSDLDPGCQNKLDKDIMNLC